MYNRITWILLIVIIGLVASLVTYKVDIANNCSVQQLDLVEEMKQYDATKDAQFCDMLDTKISKFNDACRSNIEEIDCG